MNVHNKTYLHCKTWGRIYSLTDFDVHDKVANYTHFTIMFESRDVVLSATNNATNSAINNFLNDI